MQCGDIEVNPGPKYCDIICLSKTFLTSSILNNDDRIKIDGHNLIRSDHSSGSTKEGVFYLL